VPAELVKLGGVLEIYKNDWHFGFDSVLLTPEEKISMVRSRNLTSYRVQLDIITGPHLSTN
jgi:hypothetical protein